MKLLDVIASGLAYVDGFKEADPATPRLQTQAFLEHLATHGFVVRRREGAERFQVKPSAFERCNVTEAEIRAMRRAAGLSLSALAGLAGVSAGAIHSWETGRTRPHAAKFAAVMDALAQAGATAPASNHDPS